MSRSLCGSSRGLCLVPSKHGCPIGCDVLWLGLASAVKAWSHPSSLPGPERILQTSSIIHTTSAYYQAYCLGFPYVIYLIASLFELRKVP